MKKKQNKRKKRRSSCFGTIVKTLLSLAFVAAIFVLFVNAVEVVSANDSILPIDGVTDDDYDCILVLGAGVRDDGNPSDMLEDRLKTGITLWKGGKAPVLLMSGDHGKVDYDEVNTMKKYAVANGVDADAVFLDHAGFSTYDSIYRAKDVFGAKKILIVTQEYHLSRALYIAKSFGLDANGVSANLREYSGQGVREAREILARTKDFFSTIFKPLPKYLGDPIDLTGSASQTEG